MCKEDLTPGASHVKLQEDNLFLQETTAHAEREAAAAAAEVAAVGDYIATLRRSCVNAEENARDLARKLEAAEHREGALLAFVDGEKARKVAAAELATRRGLSRESIQYPSYVCVYSRSCIRVRSGLHQMLR